MTAEADRVLAQCVADPDDDAPRLVWADLVGGERGELVVLQCDLARGGLSPDAAAARRRRERELLDRHGVAWAGSLADVALRWSFRRGFVECARLDLDGLDPAVLDEHPLLDSVAVANWDLPEHAPSLLELAGRVRGLRLDAMPLYPRGDRELRARVSRTAALAALAGDDRVRGLRAFAINRVQNHEHGHVHEIVRRAALEQLWLDDHYLAPDHVAAMLDAAPGLASLQLRSARFRTQLVADRVLRALRLGDLADPDLERLAGSTALRQLTHLGLSQPPGGPVLRALLDGSRVQVLELDAQDALPVRDVISCRLPELRVLRLRGTLDARDVAGVIDWYGPQLELLELYGVEVDDRLRARVAGEVVVAAPPFGHLDRSLLHAGSPLALAPAHACARRSEPAAIAWLGRPGGVWAIPPHPPDEWVVFGRGRGLALRIPSSMVGRHHGALLWRGDHHELHDLASTNGIVRAGSYLSVAPLADGDELTCGDVVLRYFVGPGARERAEAAVTAASA